MRVFLKWKAPAVDHAWILNASGVSRTWSRWKEILVVVQPDTILRFHRRRFRLYRLSIVQNEKHLLRLLGEYVDYDYDSETERVFTRLRDSPIGRQTESRPSPEADILGLPRVGGLHHRDAWPEAA